MYRHRRSDRWSSLFCVCLALVLSNAQALRGQESRGFSFSNIEYWAGSGTNRAAIVIDWHDGTRPHALAWGYRWNGEATGLDLWQAVTNADPGLTGDITNTPIGPMLTGIEYRRPHREYDIEGTASGWSTVADILPGTGQHDVHWTAYTWDHAGDICQTGAWSYWTLDANTNCPAPECVLCSDSVTNRRLSNDVWDIWSLAPAGTTNPPGRPAFALHYPFAVQVMDYDEGNGTTYPDWISGDLFTCSQTVLGRPTVDTTGDNWYITGDHIPVVPVYPAFRYYEMAMICSSGSVTVAFDHRVLDNPANPYGMDFIVFGNSFQVIGGGQGWTNGDPNKTSVGGSCFVERGQVSVSQDGMTWIEFTNGPYADDFAPTLGRVYDTNNVQTNLGPWNIWWGGATDPTIPVDPSMAPSNWSGYTVAELSRRYRGSAGGTAFDIGELALAQDENTGCKWIQYIRITRSGSLNPEVDAVADVSPLSPYGCWQFTRFPWMHNPVLERDAADADDDRIPNLLEYALGRDPTNAVPEAAFTTSWGRTNAQDYLLAHYTWATNAVDVGLAVERTDDLVSPDWNTNGIRQVMSEPSNSIRIVTSEIPALAEKGFVRMKVYHEK